MGICDKFDDLVVKNLRESDSKLSAKASVEFDADASCAQDTECYLDFGNLRRIDKKAKITKVSDTMYRISCSSSRVAFNLAEILGAGNETKVQLRYTNDFYSFEPDEELINMSKVPLWVVCPKQGNVVEIRRLGR